MRWQIYPSDNRKDEIDPNFFPLNEVPFQTVVLVTTPSGLRAYCKKFRPATMEVDLAIGGGNRLLYWYPKFVDKLYELAAQGKDYNEWLNLGHINNPHLFSVMFPSTKRNLDKILEGKLKSNLLSEIRVKPKS
jgi:hypothetical protein